jgi:membrane protease YdiL (CAAX protease family)
LGIQFGVGVITGVIARLFTVPGYASITAILSSVIPCGIVLYIGLKKTNKPWNSVFKLNKVPLFTWISATVFMIGLIIVFSEFDNLLNYVLPMPAFLQEVFNGLAADQPLILSVIALGITPAVTEELLFRGLILDGFTGNYSKRKAVIASSLLFGLVHLNPWQFFSGCFIGLILGWLCLNTNSILLGIYIHFFNNTLYTITSYYEPPIPGFNANYLTPVQFQPLWLDLTGVVILGLGTVLLLKGVKNIHLKNAKEENIKEVVYE